MQGPNPYSRSVIAIAGFAICFVGFVTGLAGVITLSIAGALTGAFLCFLGVSYFLLKND